MIIDNMCVFFDNKAAAASDASAALPVMEYVGRGEPVNVSMALMGGNAVSVEMTVQQADTQAGTFSDVATFTLAKPDAAPALLAFALPYATEKPFIRLSYTLNGTAAGLTVFAAVTREHFAPYAKGQYVDKGGVTA